MKLFYFRGEYYENIFNVFMVKHFTLTSFLRPRGYFKSTCGTREKVSLDFKYSKYFSKHFLPYWLFPFIPFPKWLLVIPKNYLEVVYYLVVVNRLEAVDIISWKNSFNESDIWG